MAGIRSANTKPELLLRRGLHRLGFRYRIHCVDLPGKPDLVLPRFNAAIFVNGCFWHHHDCHLFRMPSTRTEFWEKKIARTELRDFEVRKSLMDEDWRILTIWECSIKGRTKLEHRELISRVAEWIRGAEKMSEIAGTK